MIIRIGMEGGRQVLIAKALAMDAPILVSANSLWNAKRQEFRGWQCYSQLNTALDSGGFIAMKLYGGYRWAVSQYADLADRMKPEWWAQMDFCCEPEIAANKSEVFKRITRTAQHLQECQATQVKGLMPVLQGWEPSDYCQGPIYDPDFQWPALVGIGSVCRRPTYGPNGILAVVSALTKKVPPHVRFHLFGVKSQALQKLEEHFPNRIASVDSMAWNMDARWHAYHTQTACDSTARSNAMSRWYIKQTTPKMIQPRLDL